jgi:hypothetical protein
MDLESVSLVTTIEDTIDDKASSPLDHQEEPHADKQGITYQDDENGHFSYPMDQRRLSLTDLQDEAIYAFGTRLSVITEVSKEDSSNQVMTIHPSPTTRDKKKNRMMKLFIMVLVMNLSLAVMNLSPVFLVVAPRNQHLPNNHTPLSKASLIKTTNMTIFPLQWSKEDCHSLIYRMKPFTPLARGFLSLRRYPTRIVPTK